MGFPKKSANIVAGLSVAGLVLPESIAYGAIAGLPPVHALAAALAGLSVYAIAGRCRVAIVTPTSASAAVLAATIASFGGAAPSERLVLTVALVGCVGLLFVLAGFLRMGFIAAFVSRPVLRGFAFGLAVSIVLRQFFSVTGAQTAAGLLVEQLAQVLADVARWNGAALAIASLALGVMLGLRRWRKVPSTFVVLAIAVLLSFVFDFARMGVPTVGEIAFDIALPTVPRLGGSQWLSIGSASLPLALILFVEAWGTSRTLALRHGDTLDPNRELIALGLANLAAASVAGQPVGAGFSASSANDAAGATSRVAGAVAAAALAGLSLVALPLVARIPSAVLAAIVIAALAHALNPRPLLQLWRLGRDQWLGLVAAIGVLALGALYGMLLAVLLSILALVRRLSEHRIDRLGQLDGGRNYVDLARHPEAAVDPTILVVRPREPLFFANAEGIMGAIEGATSAATRAVVLSLEQSYDLDSTAVEVIGESATRLEARGQRLFLGRLKDPVRELLARAGGPLETLAAEGQRSIADAVESARNMPISKERSS
jgi:MFS superfamily sulfate permease-like transporter